jgi:dTDP-4-amino-4,6-dideoxygalactose transaminase
MHPYYQKTYGYRTGDLPTAEAEYKRYLSLPIFPTMSDEQIEQVISAVVKTVETSTR